MKDIDKDKLTKRWCELLERMGELCCEKEMTRASESEFLRIKVEMTGIHALLVSEPQFG